MNHSVNFARQLAYLLWLVNNEPLNVDEQKAALRLLLTTSRQGPVSVALHGIELQANGNAVPNAFTGVSDLTVQMARHGLALISTEAAAGPADLLGVVRILASTAVLDDGGAAAEAQRAAAGIAAIRFAILPAFAREQHVPAPSRETESIDAMEFGEVLDDPLAAAEARATPRSAQAIPAPSSPRNDGGLFAQFAATRAPSESYGALLTHLESTGEAGEIAQVLEDLVVIAEAAARQGQARVVGEILYRVALRETELPHFEQKRAAAVALKRIGKPEALRLVARELPHDVVNRDKNLAVLARAEEDGADALIEQITTVAQQRDRRVYFEALLASRSGVPALLHMLGDARWFVVRNAADLLGEMQVAEAEEPLSQLLKHEDERVRRAGTSALMSLGTPRALQAIQKALTNPVPATRMQAAAALVARKDVLSTAPQLLRALDLEKDDEVQAAFLAALGKLGTPEAVERLVNASEQKRGMFQRKTTSVRVAAVIGLAEARSDEALSALRALHEDKDEEVRAAVTLALGRIARATP